VQGEVADNRARRVATGHVPCDRIQARHHSEASRHDRLIGATEAAALGISVEEDAANTMEDMAMRRCCLFREEDVSGVSGAGVVAEGVVLSTGKVVLSWCSEYRSVTAYDTGAGLETVHGHEGRTRIAWLDPPDGCGGRD
jgi:hypothetical protein